MSRNLKATKIIVLGDAGQGSVSDAIKSVMNGLTVSLDNVNRLESIIEKERGITITEMLEKENSLPYVNVYRENIEPIKDVFNKSYFDKPKSKFHR